jgi:glyoxylase-like metal-dependent hydrolase (beta-lactamase superfamily II)
MNQIAPDVFHLPLIPRNGINVYLIGDVLIDTGVKASAGRILDALKGRTVSAIALTHAHIDHGGSARRISQELGIPIWTGAADRRAMETGTGDKKPSFERPGLAQVADALGSFPGAPVDRDLREGDELTAGFTVLDTPGHSPGHVSYWRERDRVLICGDVFFNMHVLTTVPGLRQPPVPFTYDPAVNRDSERRLARLEPDVAGFGHGPVIKGGAAAKMAALVGKLPAN